MFRDLNAAFAIISDFSPSLKFALGFDFFIQKEARLFNCNLYDGPYLSIKKFKKDFFDPVEDLIKVYVSSILLLPEIIIPFVPKISIL